MSRLKGEFEELGVDMSGTGDAKFANTKKRGRSASVKSAKRFKGERDGYTNEEGGKISRDVSGVRDPKARMKLKQHEKKMQRKKSYQKRKSTTQSN